MIIDLKAGPMTARLCGSQVGQEEFAECFPDYHGLQRVPKLELSAIKLQAVPKLTWRCVQVPAWRTNGERIHVYDECLL